MTQGKVDPTVERRTLNLKQLAEHLHLSQTTVSLVLNNAPAGRSIPQVTRDRVFEAARHFHYRPNYFARSLRNSRSMSVGVIVPDLSDGYFPVVMNAIESHLLHDVAELRVFNLAQTLREYDDHGCAALVLRLGLRRSWSWLRWWLCRKTGCGGRG